MRVRVLKMKGLEMNMKFFFPATLILFSSPCWSQEDRIDHRPCANILNNFMNAGTQFRNTLETLIHLLERIDRKQYDSLIRKLRDIQKSTAAGNFQHDAMPKIITDLKMTHPQPKWAQYSIKRMSNQVSSMYSRILQWHRPNINNPQHQSCHTSSNCELGTPKGICKYTPTYQGRTYIPKPPPSPTPYPVDSTCDSIKNEYRKAANDFTTIFKRVYKLRDIEKYRNFSLVLDVLGHTLHRNLYQHNTLKPLLQTLKHIEHKPPQANSILSELKTSLSQMHAPIRDWKAENTRYEGRRCRAMSGCLLGTPDTPCAIRK